MLPRGHRRLLHKRQGNLVLQPGTGILFGVGGQSSASSGSQQPTQASVVTGSTNSSTISAATPSPSSGSSGATSTSATSTKSQSPLKSASQSLGTSSLPSVASPSASLSSILFGPSEVNGVLEPDTTDTSNSLTESTQTPSPTSASSSQSSTSSLVSSSSITSSSSLSNVLSASTASASSQMSVSATPVSDVTPSGSGHSAQFYAGIVFLVIVVVACALSIVAWLLRSRRSRPSWCCGNSADDDVGGQEANMGLGLYLEKPFDNADPIRMLSIATNNLDSPRSYTLPAINRISDSPYPAMMRPPPVQVRKNTSEPPGQVLGPLQVKNYIAGDFSSSSENLAKPYSPRGATGAFGISNGHDPFGSSRFPAPPSQTSPSPWAPLNMRSVRAPEQVHFTQSRARGSLKAYPDDGHDSDIPSLPSPHFDRQDVLPTEDSTTDGWGATLRSSFFSALSVVKGQPTRTCEDRFTSLPSRGSSASRRKMPTGVGDIFPRSFAALKTNSDIPVSHSAPDFRPEQDFTPGSEKELMENESYNTTAPLILRKKNTLHGVGFSEGQNSHFRDIGRTTSRASSVYTCTPGMPGDIISKSTLGRQTGGLSGPSQMSVRPAFLKRGSSGVSVTSFNSDSSEDARGQTDEEMFAKRVMMLRARRKKAMSRRTSSMRQPSLAGSRSGSKRREGQK